MPDSWKDDPTATAWAKDVLENMAPKMKDSAMVMQIVPDDRIGDVKFWVELGASIMMNKPILAVCFSDVPVPPKLAQIADEIIFCPRGVDPASTVALQEAVKRMMDKHPPGGS